MKREHNITTETPLPSGYRQLEYLESTTTTYIDTLYYESASTQILSIKAKVYSAFLSKDTFDIIGNINEYDNGSKICGINTSGSFIYYKPTGTRILLSAPFNHVNDIEFTFNKSNSRLTIYNGGQTYSGSYSGLKNNSSFKLFWRGYDKLTPFVGRIYYLSIQADNTIVRDYIPTLRLLDSKPGLYDLCGSICSLTNTPFYINAGSGEFLYV